MNDQLKVKGSGRILIGVALASLNSLNSVPDGTESDSTQLLTPFEDIYDEPNYCVNQERSYVDILPDIDLFLNPSRKYELELHIDKERGKYKSAFDNLNYSQSYRNILELLWYSGNPCNDVLNITSEFQGEKSLLKECYWKGRKIDCSELFIMTPTDKGMCCVLTLKEDLNPKSKYESIINDLQSQDKTNKLNTDEKNAKFGKNLLIF